MSADETEIGRLKDFDGTQAFLLLDTIGPAELQAINAHGFVVTLITQRLNDYSVLVTRHVAQEAVKKALKALRGIAGGVALPAGVWRGIRTAESALETIAVMDEE